MRPNSVLRTSPAALLLLAGSARAQCAPAWQDVGGVWGGASTPTYAFTRSLDGRALAPPGIASRAVYVGGAFLGFGPLSGCGAAAFDGSVWLALGSGICEPGSAVYGVAGIAAPGGSIEPGVYYLGDFSQAGGVSADNIARWAMPNWSPVGTGVAVRRWTAAMWGAGIAPQGERLHAGGDGTIIHNTLLLAIVAWDGSAWTPLGSGLAPTPPQDYSLARALAIYDDDGPGPRPAALYVGGEFTIAGGQSARRVARWDGTGWEPLGTGTNGTVESLCVFDPDGPGPLRERLFVGGQLSAAGGVSTGGLAQWDGQAWAAVPGWNSGPARALAVFDDDGPGPNKPALFIGGLFTNAGGMTANKIIKWDGTRFFTLPGPGGVVGVSGWGQATEVKALAVFDEDGDGPNPGGLYVGGFFTKAGGITANSIARWGCPMPPACYANCSRDFDPVTGAHVLSIADFGCFQTRFVLQDPYADCDADGSLTIADFGCFQTKFVQGCP